MKKSSRYPAVTSSLRYDIEQVLANMPGFENIDTLLKNVKEGKRADYLFEERSVIVEQKEITEWSSTRKQKDLQSFSEEMLYKYYQNYPEKIPGIDDFSEDDVRTSERLVLEKLDPIKDLMHKANKQIESTKRLLEISNASGLLLLISDQMPLLFPHSFFARVRTALYILEEGKIKYSHLDAVLVIARASGFTANGRTRFDLIISRNPDVADAASKFAQAVLNEVRKPLKDLLLGSDINKIELRMTSSGGPYHLAKCNIGSVWLHPLVVNLRESSVQFSTEGITSSSHQLLIRKIYL